MNAKRAFSGNFLFYLSLNQSGMKTELIIRSNSSEIDFALLKDGKLIELNKETNGNKFSVGDIFLAKSGKVLSGLNASFVNVGYPKDGFLHYHDLGAQFQSLMKFIKHWICKIFKIIPCICKHECNCKKKNNG